MPNKAQAAIEHGSSIRCFRLSRYCGAAILTVATIILIANPSSAQTPTADLFVGQVSPRPPDPFVGEDFTIIIDVFNGGPDDATNVVFVDPLPTGITLLGAGGDGWSCDANAGVVTCTRPSLASGLWTDIRIEVKLGLETLGGFSNTTTVSADEFDPNIEDNTHSLFYSVTGSSDLSLVLGDTRDPVQAGSRFAYVIEANNAGPHATPNLNVLSTLPAAVAFVGAEGEGWNCTLQSGGIARCSMGSLAAGATAPTITITVDAPASPGSIVNSTTVGAIANDPNPANDTVEEETLVVAVPSAPPAVPDGDNGTLPMTVQKADALGSTLIISWDTTSCPSLVDHVLIYGQGTQFPRLSGITFDLEGADCALGGGSPFAWSGTPDPNDGSNLIWWLVLTRDGAIEGPWGSGVPGVERLGPSTSGSSGLCGATDKITSNTCGH